ncbi:hypothetical protein SPI_08107 [Niveomyces insectorum RCEF 264]|uniref:Uncharacterized protein n=1 Tax=Niveomyces insectorum RCEF 264 TaxID=1081102 RepID=A0A162MGY8_9HYPO|nr:hypothetical protein SPI_08107 [Niveomyces insectorum RCEF 264]
MVLRVAAALLVARRPETVTALTEAGAGGADVMGKRPNNDDRPVDGGPVEDGPPDDGPASLDADMVILRRKKKKKKKKNRYD